MAPTGLIIGGTGQIGRATARNLLANGWRVRLAQRSTAGLPADLAGRVELVELDRDQPDALAAGLAGGADAVIDTVAFTEAHARQWIELEADIGALVVISSASVYCDLARRTLDEAAETGFPEFPVPIGEDQPTVDAGPATYSTAKVALEQTLVQHFRRPVTILRPGAIYGDGSRHPREWWFVKRILDGRRRIPLAYAGESRFHASATANIAELCRFVVGQRGTRVLNAADPTALTVAEMGTAIAAVYGVGLDLVRLPGPPKRGLGAHPWCIPEPIVLDMSRAEALGYRPVARYEDAIGEACRSAEAAAAAGVAFPAYINALFDYAAEDADLARMRSNER
jgi:nucleoside-diphosphate-sugar epimerase